MFKAIYPDEYLDSTYEIDFEQLYDDGYRGIIFDIDNTLVPHGAPADERSKKLLNYLRERGFKIVLLSNNSKARVDMFNEELHLDAIPMGAKPFLKNYKKAMQIMGNKKNGKVSFMTKPLKKSHNLLLHRYIQGRNRLICNQHLRFGKQCHGNHHTLSLSSG